MRVLPYLSVLLFLFLLVGCGKDPVIVDYGKDLVPSDPALIEPEPVSISMEDHEPITGGDVDKHGCIASAGYTWCKYTDSCERSWELATELGFENNDMGFDKYCGQ